MECFQHFLPVTLHFYSCIVTLFYFVLRTPGKGRHLEYRSPGFYTWLCWSDVAEAQTFLSHSTKTQERIGLSLGAQENLCICDFDNR